MNTETIALVIGAVSVFGLLQQQNDNAETNQKTEKKDKNKKPLTTFQKHVDNVLHSCPFADPTLQIAYLKSGKTPQQITRDEMERLGKERRKDAK